MHRQPAVLSRLARMSALVALACAAGCSLFDRGYQPVASYLIDPPAPAKVTGESLGSLMVNRFSAIPPFDGRALLYRTTDGTWRADAYAGFIANPSDMLSASIARALEASGRCEMVGVEGIALRFNFSLEGVIEAFYADFSDPAAPQAVVRLRAYLLDRRDGTAKLVDQLAGAGTASIASSEPGKVADAMSVATGKAIQQLLEDMPKELPRDSAARPSANPAAPAANR